MGMTCLLIQVAQVPCEATVINTPPWGAPEVGSRKWIHVTSVHTPPLSVY